MSDKNLRCAVLTVARRENAYLKEWVRHNFHIGFDHVYVCDNNMDGEDNIQEFFDEVFDSETLKRITVVDRRNDRTLHRQMHFYSEYIQSFKDKWDWIAILDVDEFLTFADGSGLSTIHDFLSRDAFQYVGQVLLNWMCFGDCDLVRANLSEDVVKRFGDPVKFDGSVTGISDKQNDNWHVKPIINCRMIHNPPTFICPHFELNLSSCTADGLPCSIEPFQRPKFETAYVKHYITKTIEEFLTRKFFGRADITDGKKISIVELYKHLELFFTFNKSTAEKWDVVTSFITNHYTESEIKFAMDVIGNQKG